MSCKLSRSSISLTTLARVIRFCLVAHPVLSIAQTLSLYLYNWLLGRLQGKDSAILSFANYSYLD